MLLMTCCGTRYETVAESISHSCRETWVAVGIRVHVGGAWLDEKGTVRAISLESDPKTALVEDPITGYEEWIPLDLLSQAI